MAIHYRPMRPEDESALLGLWVAANPGTDHADWQREWELIPDRAAHTQVAVLRGGRLISSAHYALRSLRDETGVPRRVGLVSHVATHPEFRRQGHAGRLIERITAAMRRDGCDWSLLSAGEVARSLYSRHGWRNFPAPFRQGALAESLIAPSSDYAIRRFDPGSEPDGWEQLAAVYTAYNAARPLSLVRDLSYWRGPLAARLAGWEGAILHVALRQNARRVSGYVLSHHASQGFLVAELGALPEEEASIPPLLAAVAAEAARRGAQGGRLHLPTGPAIDAALARLFSSLHHGRSEELMALPLAPSWDEDRLQAIFTVPGAISWPLDEL